MWDELVRWISPRPVVRVDPHGTHTYARTRDVADGEPQVPYALHLTNSAHRYVHVVFDLDTNRDGLAGVWRDADTLAGMLAEADLEHMVSRSGPGGGIHIWVPVSEEEGLDPVDVAALGRAVARHLPSLDTGPLTNPATGAVRPPGAPHRVGGRAELLHPADPTDALSVFDAPDNSAERFQALAEAFGAEDQEQEESGTGVEGRIDRRRMRLHGRRTPMPDHVRHLLDTPPEADTSAHLARILPRLALARWSLADVQALLRSEPGAPGLEHLRTRQFDRGRRPRKEADQAAVTERQWRKAVEFAARAADSTSGGAREGRDLSELREVAARVLDAAALSQWWSRQAGPADARTLLAVLQVALRCGHLEVDVDVRRLAVAAGLGKSTTARALMRLREAGRLVLVQGSEGTQAARYRLVSPTEWPGQSLHDGAGTQGIPPLAGSLGESVFLSVGELLERVTHRLAVAAHDVWAEHSPTHPQGLGRHVEATYWALTQQVTHLNAVNESDLVKRTGYVPETIRRQLRVLTAHGLIDPVTLRPTTPAETALDAAAEALGTTGTRAARQARYEAERRVWAAWQDELARLRAPVALRSRRARRERYARTRTGRPDHAAQLARHLAAAA